MLRKKFEDDLNNLFISLNIKNGDNIMLHSNSAGINQFSNRKIQKKLYKIFFIKLLKKIGRNGTLIIPTYNYDFTKGLLFNHNSYNSQVGYLSNYFLKNFSPKRTYDPVFSHAVKGKLQNKFLNKKNYECFGEKSIFRNVYDYNFKILGFCCSLNTMTFLHYLEKKFNVGYRYNKKFSSNMIIGKKKTKVTIKYFVGKKIKDYKLKSRKIEDAFKNSSNFLFSDFGKFNCWIINSKNCYQLIKKKIKKKDDYLINE